MKILLVEDDDASISLLTRSLSAQHHIVDAVKDGEMGWTYASTFEYDLVILDLMLPKLDGLSLCKQLRSEGYTMPILMLTAQDLTIAKVRGLEAGADDYVVKPFEIAELIARVNALLRRGSQNPLPMLLWGDLALNPSTCEVTYDNRPLTLTTKEYDLLELLLRDSYRVFSSEEIIDRLWSSDAFPAEATVRSHLRRLRQKLHSAGAPEDFIGTIHGRGYYLKAPAADLPLPHHLHHPDRDRPQPHDPTSDTNLDEQERQYQAFLQQTWIATKPQCLEQLQQLGAIIDRLQSGNCSYLEQQQARQFAHKLAGTLGMFSLMSAMSIARNIELSLDLPTLVPSVEAEVLSGLVGELITEIEIDPFGNGMRAPSIERSLLLVNFDPALNDALAQIATTHAWNPISLASIEAATSYLSDRDPIDNVPTIVAVNIAADRPDRAYLDFIQQIDRQFTYCSTFVLSNNDSLHDRLAVVRNGGKFLCTANLTVEQIFTAITSFVSTSKETSKVMVVDDDLVWLRAVPQLLQAWDLKVTTLADPHQFWTVLQLVQPDVLILDVNMPDIDGLELCQVLRHDPYWQRLPILFLSASIDPNVQQQAFSVGADDYLCKPISAEELARRIRHRLARQQAVGMLHVA